MLSLSTPLGSKPADRWTPVTRTGVTREMTQSDKTFYTYILASAPHGRLYGDMTNGLVARIAQHRSGRGSAVTKRYKVSTLVWFTAFTKPSDAIRREKLIKDWPRQWKINLIERDNPQWLDLFPSLPGTEAVTQGRIS